ncbi:MAG: 30S ribosomal protein S2 [Fibrobacterota bacterium]
MAELTLQTLLEAGAHFGHQTSRWNPKMQRYILTAKNGIHLINLKETLTCIAAAKKKLVEVVESGGFILFVGTKTQAQDVVGEAAELAKQFYINQRWLGGLLTNYETVKRSIRKVDDIDKAEADGTFGILPKKEVNILKKKRENILTDLKGVREMKHLPGAVVVVDIIKEHIAVAEANRLGIPIIAIVDTNSDPTQVNYPMPANDDSLKTISLILMELATAIAATPVKYVRKDEKEDVVDGKRRVVKRKVVKKIIKKKRLKSTVEAGAADAETVMVDADGDDEEVEVVEVVEVKE